MNVELIDRYGKTLKRNNVDMIEIADLNISLYYKDNLPNNKYRYPFKSLSENNHSRK